MILRLSASLSPDMCVCWFWRTRIRKSLLGGSWLSSICTGLQHCCGFAGLGGPLPLVGHANWTIDKSGLRDIGRHPASLISEDSLGNTRVNLLNSIERTCFVRIFFCYWKSGVRSRTCVPSSFRLCFGTAAGSAAPPRSA